MTAAASSPGPIDPSRALQPVRPAALQRRASMALATVAQRALPVVAQSIASGVAVLAAERAVRNLVTGTAARVLPAQPPRPAAPTRMFAAYTETTVIERFRVRR
jgi:hypothetical protein